MNGRGGSPHPKKRFELFGILSSRLPPRRSRHMTDARRHHTPTLEDVNTLPLR